MTKVTFYCDSGASHAERKETVDLEEDWNFKDGEWESLSEEEKYKIAEEWAFNGGLEIYYEEL